MNVTDELVKEFIRSMKNIQASRYTCGAAMTVMFYDFLLTFADEVKYVWGEQRKLSVAKLMFLWNRYFVIPWVILSNYHIAGFRGPLSDTFCKFETVSVAIVQGLSIIIGIQLLALRVLALYQNNRIIKYCLYSWLAACHISFYTMSIISMRRFVPYLSFLSYTNTCYTIADPLIRGVYVPPLLAEAAVMILQVLNHFQRRKRDISFNTPLVTALYRDGYLYFSLIMTLRLFCVCIYAFGPQSAWYMLNQMDFPLTAALVSRFFIQLRGAVLKHDPAMIDSQHYSKHGISHPAVKSFGSKFERDSRDIYWPVDGPVPLQQLRRMRVDRV